VSSRRRWRAYVVVTGWSRVSPPVASGHTQRSHVRIDEMKRLVNLTW